MQSDIGRLRFLAGALFFLLIFTGICYGAAPCRLDNEEYAVCSALLFPEPGGGKPEPAATPSDILRPPPELAGVWPGPYAILSSTMTIGVQVIGGKDAALLKDFNRKNTQVCQLDDSRLAAVLADANRSQVHIISDAQQKGLGGGSAGGLVRLSRVGFNSAKTEAVVEVHAIYDLEAGIGYRAFLQKADPNANWRLQDVVKTRQF